MLIPVAQHRFFGFFPPYRRLQLMDHPGQFPSGPFPSRGFALLWNLGVGDWATDTRAIRGRPPGIALVILLPPASQIGASEALLRSLEESRPHSVLPHMEELDPEELATVLRRFPSELAIDVTDYLAWRGLDVDTDTRQLIRKTLQLSGEIRTVAGLARAFYMSRRALGRRFMTRGLPVPSHWLHFGRLLRASIRLQDPATSLFSVGCDLGYPDGFALSNQLKRLTGLRPSVMRDCLGWEWIVETWLAREAECGNLSPGLKEALFPAGVAQSTRGNPANSAGSEGTRRSNLRVAEERARREGSRGRVRNS